MGAPESFHYICARSNAVSRLALRSSQIVLADDWPLALTATSRSAAMLQERIISSTRRISKAYP
jgi:hypothetical protein